MTFFSASSNGTIIKMCASRGYKTTVESQISKLQLSGRVS